MSDRITAKATIYRNAIDNYIYLQDSGTQLNGLPVLDHQQADALLQGAELSIEAQMTDWLALNATGELVRGRRRGSHEDCRCCRPIICG